MAQLNITYKRSKSHKWLDTFPELCWHHHIFPRKSAMFVMSRNTDIDCVLIHNLFCFTFFELLKAVLINLGKILMISAKLATPGLLKIKVVWNKGYDVISSVDEVINKISSGDSSHIVNVVMWIKFGNPSITMRELVINCFYKNLTRKINFFEGCSWFKFKSLGLTPGMALEFYISVAIELNLKVKVFRANYNVCRNYRGKREHFALFSLNHPPPTHSEYGYGFSLYEIMPIKQNISVEDNSPWKLINTSQTAYQSEKWF